MRVVILSILFLATPILAEESPITLTVDGITYSNVTFGTKTPAAISIRHSSGIATIPLDKMPPELQEKFGYDAKKAEEWKVKTEEGKAKERAKANAAEAERKKLAGAQQWEVVVQQVLPDALIVSGFLSKDSEAYPVPGVNPDGSTYHTMFVPPTPASRSIALVGHPQQNSLADGNRIVTYAYKEGIRQFSGDTLEVWVYCKPPASKK